jgi:hypothetical protein
MSQRVDSSILPSNDDNATDCLTYLVRQCHSYVANIGLVMKKVVCKTWPIVSRPLVHKKRKQVNENPFVSFSRKMTGQIERWHLPFTSCNSKCISGLSIKRAMRKIHWHIDESDEGSP